MRSVFDEMMSRYEDGSTEDYSNALHEVMQQVALAGLYRGGFFDKAAFYGGTCLRIFYDLQRFSEDLDFSLLQPDSTFNLENYFDNIVTEFKALGRDVIIMKK
jgi:predicted nucleotidyltransferase component of viral defense system